MYGSAYLSVKKFIKAYNQLRYCVSLLKKLAPMKPSLLILPLLALLALSCENADEPEVVNTLGTDVRFEMTEYLESESPTLSFKFLTQKDFPCINYRISSDYQVNGRAITISLSEIAASDVCLEAIGPAASFLDLGTLAEGEYDLTINVGKNLVNTGVLSVAEAAYRLTLNEAVGLLIDNPTLLRIPSGLIWGTLRFPQEESPAGSFFSKLRGIGASEQVLPQGDYGYFTTNASGHIETDNTPFGTVEQSFLMRYDGDARQLERLIEEISADYSSDVSIRMHTTRGEDFTSHSRK